MRRLIFLVILMGVFMAAPALADMGGSTIYFNFPGKMYSWDPVNGKQPAGDLPSKDGQFWTWKQKADGTWVRDYGAPGTGAMTDIAFDTNGKMYGVNTWNPTGLGGYGSFWSINPLTGEANFLTSTFSGTEKIGDQVTALSNYGAGKFYAAVDGGTVPNDRGHLYDWTWDGSALTGTDLGAFVPDKTAGSVSAALFGNNTDIFSLGDLWYWNDVLYGTLKADDSLTGNEARFILASIDPYATGGPLATALASLDAWSDGVAGGAPKYVPGTHPTGQQFQAMVNYGSYVGLLRADGYLFYWDGTTSLAKLDGQNIFWTGIDVGCSNIVGATAVPVPAAVLLGMLGLSVAGVKLRRRA